MSEQKKNVRTALIEFQKSCPAIDMSATVSFGSTKFKYAPLGDILKAVKDPMTENGLVQYHTVVNDKIITVVEHPESDTMIASESVLDCTGKMQDIGAKITYWRRYHLVSLLGIIAEEDADHGDLSNDAPKAMDAKGMALTLAAIREGKATLEGVIAKRTLTAEQIRQIVNEENNAAFPEEKEETND